MRICIVGSGLAGLCTAFYLTGFEDTRLVVFERAAVLGGTSVAHRAEHGGDLVLGGGSHLRAILREIPAGDGRTLHDQLRPLDPADRARGRGRGRGRTRRRSATTWSFGGPTGPALVAPWVQLLEARGVGFNVNAGVRLLRPERSGVFVHSERGAEKFDAVVVTAFLPDVVALLATSGIAYPARRSGRAARRRLEQAQPHLYFASGHDAGEGAARSAFTVVRQMRSDYGLVPRGG